MEITGADGGALGETEADAADGSPVPNEFTADTWKTYAVPSVSPVTTVDVAVPTPSLKVLQLVGELAGAYCTT